MTESLIGREVPDFSLPGTDGLFRLSALRGQAVVLYFYPKDATPGCTTEAMQFRDLHGEFAAAGARIFGISRDGLKSHDSFRTRLALPFHLLSDADEAACRLFATIRLKKLYGKEVRGIERSTFLIDRNGVVRNEWRGVKADGHAREVLTAVQALR